MVVWFSATSLVSILIGTLSAGSGRMVVPAGFPSSSAAKALLASFSVVLQTTSVASSPKFAIVGSLLVGVTVYSSSKLLVGSRQIAVPAGVSISPLAANGATFFSFLVGSGALSLLPKARALAAFLSVILLAGVGGAFGGCAVVG